MKKPGESLSEYVKRRIREEGALTAAQERAGFIDGNKDREGQGVVIALGGGKSEKQAPVPNDKERMPSTDCTDDDQGAGFIVGLGSGTEQQAKPKRGSTTSPRTPRKGSGKSKGK